MESAQIEESVNRFFGNRRVCFAKPGTDRHSSNFYGDTLVCRFTRSELVSTVECYHENYGDWPNGETGEQHSNTIQESIDEILDDMQFEKPTE